MSKTRQQLLEERKQLAQIMQQEAEELDAAIRAEQQERIESIQAQVAQLESEGVVIKLLLDGKAVRQAPKISNKAASGPQRGVREPKWRDPIGGATWSGIGPKPAWFGRAVPYEPPQALHAQRGGGLDVIDDDAE